MVEPKANDLMERIVSLCKRRGLVFQSSEIYGGINGFWDYGPLGAELKRNVKDYWWRAMTRRRDDVVGLEATIIMHPKIWEASGHTTTFADPDGRLSPDQETFPRRPDRSAERRRLSLFRRGGSADKIEKIRRSRIPCLLTPGKNPESRPQNGADSSTSNAAWRIRVIAGRTDREGARIQPATIPRTAAC